MYTVYGVFYFRLKVSSNAPMKDCKSHRPKEISMASSASSPLVVGGSPGAFGGVSEILSVSSFSLQFFLLSIVGLHMGWATFGFLKFSGLFWVASYDYLKKLHTGSLAVLTTRRRSDVVRSGDCGALPVCKWKINVSRICNSKTTAPRFSIAHRLQPSQSELEFIFSQVPVCLFD